MLTYFLVPTNSVSYSTPSTKSHLFEVTRENYKLSNIVFQSYTVAKVVKFGRCLLIRSVHLLVNFSNATASNNLMFYGVIFCYL